jgi:hypothetical protein
MTAVRFCAKPAPSASAYIKKATEKRKNIVIFHIAV